MVRVLLVASSPRVREQVHAALVDRGGFKVVGEAGNGAAAVESVASIRPDVVIVDVVGLPGIEGRELLTRLHEASSASRLVVFSVAGSSDRAWIEEHVDGHVVEQRTLDYLVALVHSVVEPRTEAPLLKLTDDPRRIGEARRFVRRQLTEWGEDDLVDDASLVVTELAANAIEHAKTDYEVRMSLGTTSVRIEVCDSGRGTPEPRPPTPHGEGGRGLFLVASIAASWGMEDLGPSKVVWADLLRGD